MTAPFSLECQLATIPFFAQADDPDILFARQSCDGRTGVLVRSADRGTTWSIGAATLYPWRLVAGPAAPYRRLFLHASSSLSSPTNQLLKSDDDGATWSTLPMPHVDLDAERPADGRLPPALAGGGGITPATLSWSMTGLAAHPSEPDRLYCSLSIYWWQIHEGQRRETPVRRRVLASADLGATWTDLAVRELPSINGLVVSPDGRYLLTSSGRSTWRLPLS